MKIDRTEIFLNSTIEKSILDTIKNAYNESHSSKILENLKIDGNVGTSTFLNNPDCKFTKGMVTYYIIVTVINNDLIRVELCYNYHN